MHWEIIFFSVGFVISFSSMFLQIHKNTSLTNEQRTPFRKGSNETQVAIIPIVAFFIAFALDTRILMYVSAVLFVLSPSFDAYRFVSYINDSQLPSKKYYVSLTALRFIGFSISFIGVALWALDYFSPALLSKLTKVVCVDFTLGCQL